MTEKLLARVAAVAAIGAATAGTTPAALAMASTGQAGIQMPTTREPYAQTTDSNSSSAEGGSQENPDPPESDVPDPLKGVLRNSNSVQDPEESQEEEIPKSVRLNTEMDVREYQTANRLREMPPYEVKEVEEGKKTEMNITEFSGGRKFRPYTEYKKYDKFKDYTEDLKLPDDSGPDDGSVHGGETDEEERPAPLEDSRKRSYQDMDPDPVPLGYSESDDDSDIRDQKRIRWSDEGMGPNDGLNDDVLGGS
jgi:hypothetical protein